MKGLLRKSRAVAGLTCRSIEEDTRLFESQGGQYRLQLVEPEQEDRPEAQAFIAEAYRRVFDARLSEFYPSLVSLHSADTGLQGVAGARYAEGQPLFVEQYLTAPVDRLLSQMGGSSTSRSQVVEVGNLSVSRAAMTYPFISLIGGWLMSHGIDWIVYSLTDSLQRLFSRSGVELLDLGPARSERLAPSDNDWGSYYQHGPRVMATPLSSGLFNFQLHHGSHCRSIAPALAIHESAGQCPT